MTFFSSLSFSSLPLPISVTSHIQLCLLSYSVLTFFDILRFFRPFISFLFIQFPFIFFRRFSSAAALSIAGPMTFLLIMSTFLLDKQEYMDTEDKK
ncbi:hypothetical protein BCR41DRAFT_31271 [Lobosporangium transversale]|uniref:Uncharacterized protein n=1 Tax=Lobosporangium transversale TaxID=64571 RepID=A0A1Y2FXB4_9FUNG|nr:hypothetical protein BCR41DRAFT_31271 [Lobosporangium transversale]ORY88703.1 hypothetical protein BCR41DRAFT_31271 [Lobosporangium transversale]|eukprot:XP_021875011.1 hypothetical protein BCR41DRAFT_31271 [Lobosporangium transversale]